MYVIHCWNRCTDMFCNCVIFLIYILLFLKIKNNNKNHVPSTLTPLPLLDQHQGWSFSFIHCKYTQTCQYMIMLQPKQPPLSSPNPLTNDALLWPAWVRQYPLTVHSDSPAEARSWPLGEKARARMDPLCPDSRRMGLPSWMFHRRIVLSHDPDAT